MNHKFKLGATIMANGTGFKYKIMEFSYHLNQPAFWIKAVNEGGFKFKPLTYLIVPSDEVPKFFQLVNMP